MSLTLATAFLAATMRVVVAPHAYAEGAPPGFSGGFKEESCHACHFHEELNAGGGRVTIEGVPASFEAGQRYTLSVTLTRAGMKRTGFQLATRLKDTGAQAGTLAPGPGEGERVTVDTQVASNTRARRRADLRSAQPTPRSGRSSGSRRTVAGRSSFMSQRTRLTGTKVQTGISCTRRQANRRQPPLSGNSLASFG